MYALKVFHAGGALPTETRYADRAAEVLELIPALLARHADCERIVVMSGEVRLFAVDCAGNRTAG